MSTSQYQDSDSTPERKKSFVRDLEGKIAVALGGALLTAITTVALPWWLSQLAQDRQAQQHRLDEESQTLADARKDRQEQAQALTQRIEDPVLQRLAATEFLIQLHGRPASDGEVHDVWTKYWSAYENYFIFAESNEVPQDRLTVNGPQAEYLDRHPVLWTYLDTVIGPEFEKIHACLIAAHETYDANTARPSTGSNAQFKSCLAPGPSDNKFWNQTSTEPTVSAIWTQFKSCVGTFLIQLHYGLEWREQLAEEAPEPDRPHAMKLSQCPPDYTGDQWCRQMRYNSDVYDQVSNDCGPLPPDELKALDLTGIK